MLNQSGKAAEIPVLFAVNGLAAVLLLPLAVKKLDSLPLAFGLFLVLGCCIVLLAGISGSRRLLSVPAPLLVYAALSAISYPFTLWTASVPGAIAILFLQPVVSLSIAAKLIKS